MHCLLYGNYIRAALRHNKQSIFEPHSAPSQLCTSSVFAWSVATPATSEAWWSNLLCTKLAHVFFEQIVEFAVYFEAFDVFPDCAWTVVADNAEFTGEIPQRKAPA